VGRCSTRGDRQRAEFSFSSPEVRAGSKLAYSWNRYQRVGAFPVRTTWSLFRSTAALGSTKTLQEQKQKWNRYQPTTNHGSYGDGERSKTGTPAPPLQRPWRESALLPWISAPMRWSMPGRNWGRGWARCWEACFSRYGWRWFPGLAGLPWLIPWLRWMPHSERCGNRMPRTPSGRWIRQAPATAFLPVFSLRGWRKSLREAGEWGNAAGALSVTRTGSMAGLLGEEDVSTWKRSQDQRRDYST
jgi:hypothetical protein